MIGFDFVHYVVDFLVVRLGAGVCLLVLSDETAHM